jgi:hypothetical protein
LNQTIEPIGNGQIAQEEGLVGHPLTQVGSPSFKKRQLFNSSQQPITILASLGELGLRETMQSVTTEERIQVGTIREQQMKA